MIERSITPEMMIFRNPVILVNLEWVSMTDRQTDWLTDGQTDILFGDTCFCDVLTLIDGVGVKKKFSDMVPEAIPIVTGFQPALKNDVIKELFTPAFMLQFESIFASW